MVTLPARAARQRDSETREEAAAVGRRFADIAFFITGARGTPRGIAAANLNVLEAPVDPTERTRRGLHGFGLTGVDRDRACDRPDSVPFRAYGGRKVGLAHAVAAIARA